jgi:hypothetical protein
MATRSRTPWILLSAAALALCVTTARAAPIDEELASFDARQDIRALGMGGGTVSQARGADAVSTNPAGLAALAGSEIAASGGYRNIAANARLGADTTDASVGNLRLGHLALAYRGEDTSRWGVGATFGSVRSLDANIETAGIETLGDFARFDVFERRDTVGDVYALSLGVGVEVARGVRVGVATDFLEGDRDRSLLFDASDISNVDPELDFALFDDVVTRTVSATRLRFGLEVAVVPGLAVGATVAAPYEYDIVEDWLQRTRFDFDDGSDLRETDSGVTGYRLSVPAAYSGGVTIHSRAWRVSASVAYSDWSKASYSRAPADDVNPEQFARSYDAAADALLGAEWAAHDALTVRGGIGIGHRAYADEDAADPVTISLGISTPLAADAVLDVAYVRSQWDALGDGVEQSFHTDRLVVGARLLF